MGAPEKRHWHWEYLVEKRGVKPITPWLNEMGQEGWELVAIEAGDYYIFKRALIK